MMWRNYMREVPALVRDLPRIIHLNKIISKMFVVIAITWISIMIFCFAEVSLRVIFPFVVYEYLLTIPAFILLFLLGCKAYLERRFKKIDNWRWDTTRHELLKRLQDFARIRGGHCILLDVKITRIKIRFECARGHQWNATIESVVQRHWCPYCDKNSTPIQN